MIRIKKPFVVPPFVSRVMTIPNQPFLQATLLPASTPGGNRGPAPLCAAGGMRGRSAPAAGQSQLHSRGPGGLPAGTGTQEEVQRGEQNPLKPDGTGRSRGGTTAAEVLPQPRRR